MPKSVLLLGKSLHSPASGLTLCIHDYNISIGMSLPIRWAFHHRHPIKTYCTMWSVYNPILSQVKGPHKFYNGTSGWVNMCQQNLDNAYVMAVYNAGKLHNIRPRSCNKEFTPLGLIKQNIKICLKRLYSKMLKEWISLLYLYNIIQFRLKL